MPKDKEFEEEEEEEEEQSITPRKNLIAENALLLELYSRDRKNLSLEEIEKNIQKSKKETQLQKEKEREIKRQKEETERKEKRERREMERIGDIYSPPPLQENPKISIKKEEAEALYKKAIDLGLNPPPRGTYQPGKWYAIIDKLILESEK